MKPKYGPVIFFGNEKLASGISQPKSIIKDALVNAGFEIEQIISGPLSELKNHKAKIAVLAAYGQIIPQKIIDEFPLGIINIHPSLLPLHRGPTPIESAILSGDKKTGVSIMKLDQKMDSGPLFGLSEVALNGTETKQYLAEKLAEIGSAMLVELLPGIIDGSLIALPQDESKATYDSLIKKADGKIDWSKPAEQIEREIRAYAGWPKSYTRLGQIDLVITDAHSAPSNGSVKPGTIEIIDDTHLVVYCKNSLLCIDSVHPSGKNEMSVAEFLRGYGSRLVG